MKTIEGMVEKALDRAMAQTPKGETIPQTVENLQAIMAKDAVLMQEQAAEISKLRHQNQRLSDRLMKRKRHDT